MLQFCYALLFSGFPDEFAAVVVHHQVNGKDRHHRHGDADPGIVVQENHQHRESRQDPQQPEKESPVGPEADPGIELSRQEQEQESQLEEPSFDTEDND